MSQRHLRKLHWVNILFFTGTGTGAILITPIYLYWYGVSWGLVALFFVYAAMTAMSVTAGYHRFLSHRSYEAHPILKLAYLLFGAATFQGSALQWCSDHRRHHRFVDTEKDPHNIREGFLWAHIGWLFFEEDPQITKQYPDDLANDAMLQWQDKYYVPLAIFMCFGVPTGVGLFLGSPFGGLLFGGLLRVVAGSHATFLINSYAHTFGTRPYSEIQTARDSVLLALFAWGEGYHNYHHQFASDYRNGIRWYQWDPTKWLISGLSYAGLTSRLKRIPAGEVQRVRMRAEEQSLLQRGFPAERLESLKQKMETAQTRIKEFREECQRIRLQMEASSRARLRLVKAEMKAARMERKLAMRQWALYLRAWRRVPALARS